MYQYSARDLYPNLGNVMSTGDMTAPEYDEQVVYTKGSDGNIPSVVTTTDRSHLIWTILGILALLFAFGLVQ